MCRLTSAAWLRGRASVTPIKFGIDLSEQRFPLTPAVALGERENHLPRCDKSSRAGLSSDGRRGTLAMNPLGMVGTRSTASLTSGKYRDAVERVPTRFLGRVPFRAGEGRMVAALQFHGSGCVRQVWAREDARPPDGRLGNTPQGRRLHAAGESCGNIEACGAFAKPKSTGGSQAPRQ
jgi:hypothetical protein